MALPVPNLSWNSGTRIAEQQKSAWRHAWESVYCEHGEVYKEYFADHNFTSDYMFLSH